MELPNHLEALMNRSPISQADITSFLRVMRRTQSGTLVTSKLLAGKIQATNEAQAIHSFDVLEACLESETEGSIEFRTEIGRYRFLNEIIRILSPKYLGDKTPGPVKERAIKFLEDAAGTRRKRWFPSEHSKIQAVYQSLVDGGVIQRNPKFPSTEADEEAELQKSIFDRAENAAILKKLLQSRDPADLQAANRLIKNLVEEESKRIERRAELHSLIDRIETSTSLLTEMLSQRQIDKEIVDELADTCRSLQQRLGGIATETNDEITSLLQASEDLETVLDLYDKMKDFQGDCESGNIENGACGENESKPIQILSLADELLLSLDLGTLNDDRVAVTSNNGNSDLESRTEKDLVSISGDNLLNLDVDLSPPIPNNQSSLINELEKQPNNPLDEIGRLSRELMEQSLKGGINFPLPTGDFKRTDKTPLSQLIKPSSGNSIPVSDNTITSSQFFSGSEDNQNVLMDLDLLGTPISSMNTISVSTCNSGPAMSFNSIPIEKDFSGKLNHEIMQKSPVSDQDYVELKQLLNSIKELNLDEVEPIQVLNPLDLHLGNDSSLISLTLTFATVPEFPSVVKVGILTFINKSPTLEVQNYVFQIIPPKGWQIKLLPPSSMQLPAWTKKFLPPPILTQAVLIVSPRNLVINAPSMKPKMKFILSYSTDDDTALHNGDFQIPSSLFA